MDYVSTTGSKCGILPPNWSGIDNRPTWSDNSYNGILHKIQSN